MPGARRIGPFCRDKTLTMIDRRSRAGRFWAACEKELIDHVGGTPTPAQRLIIQAATLKATRMALLSDMLLSGDTPSEGSDHHALAWLNSMRLDLQALGLEPKVIKTPQLADLIDVSAA
jgi:hypothetical protein